MHYQAARSRSFLRIVVATPNLVAQARGAAPGRRRRGPATLVPALLRSLCLASSLKTMAARPSPAYTTLAPRCCAPVRLASGQKIERLTAWHLLRICHAGLSSCG